MDPRDQLSDLVPAPGHLRRRQLRRLRHEARRSNFPVKVASGASGVFQTSLAGATDGFVTKLASDGQSIVYSTYLGGAANDWCGGIAVDGPAGTAHVIGTTSSANFPTAAAFQVVNENPGVNDAFVTKLAANGATLVFSTYLGGIADEQSAAIALDGSGNVWVTGSTTSADFPVNVGPGIGFGTDAFVARFTPTGAWSFSRFYGGSGLNDFPRGIAVDASGNAFVSTDILIGKFTSAGALSVQTTASGGPIAVDSTGNPVVASSAGDGVTVSRYTANLAPTPLYTVLLASGSDTDNALAIAAGPGGTFFVAGKTLSTDFTTLGAAQPASGGGQDVFLLKASPLTVSSVSPSSGPTAGGTAVTISGDSFAAPAAVTFGGTAATDVVVVSSTAITATTPAHALGAVNVAVTVAGFTATKSAFTYVPPPIVAAVSPTGGVPAGGASLTLTGNNFLSGATVALGGAPATNVAFVDARTLTATAPAHAAGLVGVTVTNPDGQVGTLPAAFMYAADPTVTAVAPGTGPLVGRTPVTITGTGFLSGATVTIGGAPASSVVVVSGTSITAETPVHGAGSADVVVANPSGQAGVLAGGFTYVPPPAPASVTPAHGPATLGGPVAIAGASFTSPATVTFGGVPATDVVVVSPTDLTATAPVHAAGAANVAVTGAYGSGQITGGFTYDPPPTLASLAPASGTTEGGNTAILTGTGFVTNATVSFGGTPSPSAVVVNSTSITAVLPPHAAGTVAVVVRNPDQQTATLAGGYTFAVPGTGAPAASTTDGTRSAFGCSSSGGGAGVLGLAALGLVLLPRRRRTAAPLLVALLLPAAALAAAPVPVRAPVRAPTPTSTPTSTSGPASTPAPSSTSTPIPLPPPPKPAKPKDNRPRVAIMPIKAGLGVEPKLAELVTDALVADLTARGLATITSKDVEAALGFERQKQMMGCTAEASCLAEIGGALGADRVVFGDLAQVKELTILSLQIFNAKTGAVEKRFHERTSGGEAADILDATERAGAELFPGTTRAGTARRSVAAGPARPFSVFARGGYDVKEPGGLAVLLAEYRVSRTVRLALGPAMAGQESFGATLRAAWYPITFADSVSLYAAGEGLALFPGDTLLGVTGLVGLEWAVGSSLSLSVELPVTGLVSAPSEYRTTYFMPAFAVGWRF